MVDGVAGSVISGQLQNTNPAAALAQKTAREQIDTTSRAREERSVAPAPTPDSSGRGRYLDIKV